MKHLGISGGATKITGLYAACEVILKQNGYKPDIITGVSAGSILSLPLVMDMWDETKEILWDLNVMDFFDKKPVSAKGGINLNGLLRLFRGKSSIGTMNKLRKILSEQVTEIVFDDYRAKHSMRLKPTVMIGVTNYSTGRTEFKAVHEMKYQEYLDYVIASSSIPVYSEPIKLNGDWYYDGGVTDFIGTKHILTNFEVTENVSIYSRDFLTIERKEWKPKGVMGVLSRTLEIMQYEILRSEYETCQALCKNRDIKNTDIFLPIVLESMFDTDINRLRELYYQSKERAQNITESWKKS